MNSSSLFNTLDRLIPPIFRGLALGFGVLAIATAVFGMDVLSDGSNRFLLAVLYAVVALICFAVARRARDLLRRLWKSD